MSQIPNSTIKANNPNKINKKEEKGIYANYSINNPKQINTNEEYSKNLNEVIKLWNTWITSKSVNVPSNVPMIKLTKESIEKLTNNNKIKNLLQTNLNNSNKDIMFSPFQFQQNLDLKSYFEAININTSILTSVHVAKKLIKENIGLNMNDNIIFKIINIWYQELKNSFYYSFHNLTQILNEKLNKFLLKLEDFKNEKPINEIIYWKRNFFPELISILNSFQTIKMKGSHIQNFIQEINSFKQELQQSSKNTNQYQFEQTIYSIFQGLETQQQQTNRSYNSRDKQRYLEQERKKQEQEQELQKLITFRSSLISKIESIKFKINTINSLLILAKFQNTILIIICLWISICQIIGKEKIETNFIYLWNEQQWKQRIIQWSDLNLSFLQNEQNEHNKLNINFHKINVNEIEKIIFVEEPKSWNLLFNWNGIIPLKLDNKISDLDEKWKKIINTIKIPGEIDQALWTKANKLNQKLRWKTQANELSVNSIEDLYIINIKKWKELIIIWLEKYKNPKLKKIDLWNELNGYIQKVVQIQNTWWKLFLGNNDQSLNRIYWNIWWDLQRFYLQHFYLLLTVEDVNNLYINFNYRLDTNHVSLEGKKWLEMEIKKRTPSQKLFEQILTTKKLSVETDRSTKDLQFSFPDSRELFTLQLLSLRCPSWKLRSYWNHVLEKDCYTFLPISIGKNQYWILLNSLFERLESSKNELPIFYDWNLLVQSFKIQQKPQPQSQQKSTNQLSANWLQLFQKEKIKTWKIITWNKDDNQIWDLLKWIPYMSFLRSNKKKTQLQILEVIHIQIWVDWIGMILVGQSMDTISFNFDETFKLLNAYLNNKDNLHYLSQYNKEIFKTNWYSFESQIDFIPKQNTKTTTTTTLRNRVIYQEKTGTVWTFKGTK